MSDFGVMLATFAVLSWLLKVIVKHEKRIKELERRLDEGF